jgi:putative endonuclease
VRPDRHDEIDLVARRGDTLVFVEVKTRKREDFGRPLSAVNARKRHALKPRGGGLCAQGGYPRLFFRFDVIEVLGQPEEGER